MKETSTLTFFKLSGFLYTDLAEILLSSGCEYAPRKRTGLLCTWCSNGDGVLMYFQARSHWFTLVLTVGNDRTGKE